MENFEAKLANPLSDFADELDKLQAQENDGRGVSCVKMIVSCLRLGNIEGARATYVVDGDKIRNYPEIEKIILEKLVA